MNLIDRYRQWRHRRASGEREKDPYHEARIELDQARARRKIVWSETFRYILSLYPRPEGEKWTPGQIEEASGGRVSASEVRALRDGEVEAPWEEQLENIAEAVGFRTGLWFKGVDWWERVYERCRGGWRQREQVIREEERKDADNRLSKLLNRLFEERVNESTGEPFTNEEVARLSEEYLSEEDVEEIREGELTEPSMAQLLKLCDIFEVEPGYWKVNLDAPFRVSPIEKRAIDEPWKGKTTHVRGLWYSGPPGEDYESIPEMLSKHLRKNPEKKIVLSQKGL